MKKVLILVDSGNFYKSIDLVSKERKEDRAIDYHKLNKFVIDYLKKNHQYKEEKLTHIRTYYYDGEYTDNLIKKIKDSIKISKKKNKDTTELEKCLEKTIKTKAGQEKFYNKAKTFYYFEIKKKPVQFAHNKGVFQKGVDVEIAVDLVSFAFKNVYDVAVLFSGDIDLIESIKSIKSLGKHVVIFAHEKSIAKDMMQYADLYVDFKYLKSEILDGFTHIFDSNFNNNKLK